MASKMMWLHCYDCGEQFETEVDYFYSSKQVCGSCRKPKQVEVEVSRYVKRQVQGRAKREAVKALAEMRAKLISASEVR